MRDSRPRLPKDVATLFKDSELPEDVARRCRGRPTPPPARVCIEGPVGESKVDTFLIRGTSSPRLFPVKDVQIERLMKTVPCVKGHACYRYGFETLCRARPLLGGRMLECLERRASCSHQFSFVTRAVCRCAIRRHIMQNLGR